MHADFSNADLQCLLLGMVANMSGGGALLQMSCRSQPVQWWPRCACAGPVVPVLLCSRVRVRPLRERRCLVLRAALVGVSMSWCSQEWRNGYMSTLERENN